MYKAIIVDDEALVRIGLKNTIQWTGHGFELIGDYANGRDALEAIEQLKPDLVISDISMPFMDGLELAGAVVSNFPYTKMIILTGYDDFEYAQQAIRLKVSDFILKPITANEIRKLLDKVKREMDEEKQRREDLNTLNSQLKQSLPLLKERFLERLVAIGLRKKEIEERLAYFQLPSLSPPALLLVVDIDDFGDRELHSYEHDAEVLRFAAFHIFEEIAEGRNVLLFRTREERMAAIVYGQPDQSLLYDEAFALAEEVRHAIEKFLKFTVTIGVGRVCESTELLRSSYKSALSALDYRFLLGKNRILSISDMEGNSSGTLPLHFDWDRKLVAAVKTGSVKEVEQLIEHGVSDLKKSRMPIEACLLQIQKIVLSLMNTIQELGPHDRQKSIDRRLMLTDVYRFKTLDDLEAWLLETARSVMTAVADSRSHYTNDQVLRAVEYIETNYAHDKLSLHELCRHVLMSTSYFSLVFKQHTGETFIEYLTGVRIAKAKELLRNTGLKFYEIAGQVGYSDPNYFSILFKKHTGSTPKDYREKHAKGSEREHG